MQAAEAQRIVEDARRDLRRLRGTRDEKGQTWEGAQRDGVRWEDGVLVVDASAALEFSTRRVPGSDESYAQASTRVVEDAKGRLERAVSQEQRTRLRTLETTPVFGPRPPEIFHTQRVDAASATEARE